MAALRLVAAAVLLAGTVPAIADPIDRWAGPIAEASARFSIPADWIRRVMRAESGGRTMLGGRPIMSRAGAMGLMQLMPGTWHDMRLALGLGADPHNPRDNILAGTLYLRLIYDRFGYPGLFAAYNAGPRRYAGVLAGTRPLPGETRAYVAEVASVDIRRIANGRAPDRLFALNAGAEPAARSSRLPAGLFVALNGSPRR